MSDNGLLRELERSDLSRAEILRRLRKAARDRDRAEELKAQADRAIAETTAIARARDLVPMQEMTEALGQTREFVYWLQREHGCTQGDLRKLKRESA